MGLGTTPGPSLDFDVFRAILNHLSIADLKQIAVVSHLFHEEALREILLRGVRFTRTVTKLHAFCIFMCDRRRRDPPLFSFLRTLHINITSFTMGEHFHPDPLFTVLSRASSLNDLEIYWTNDMFSPTYDEHLAAIIPKLRHLRRLRLFTPELYTYVRKLVAQIVRTLRSQLDILEIGCWPTPSYVYEDFPPNLGVYQTNLRVLGISYPDLVDTPWIPLPTVLTLKLLLPTDFPTSLRHIAQVFPSLRELAVSNSQALGPLPPWDIDPSQAHARNEALAFQRSGGGWRSLDVLAASTIVAWTLGLTCPVGCLRLGEYDVAHHAGSVDVVSRACPKKVVLALKCKKHCAHPEDEQPLLLFPTDNGPTTGAVTHAVVFLMMEHVPNPYITSVDQITAGIIGTVGSHVKHSRLEYLHVAIGMHFVYGENNADPEWEMYEALLTESLFFRSVFQGIDIELLVSGLAAAEDHLQTIVLTIYGRGQSVWTIDRCETGQTISKVANPVYAREIIEQEERSYMYRM